MPQDAQEVRRSKYNNNKSENLKYLEIHKCLQNGIAFTLNLIHDIILQLLIIMIINELPDTFDIQQFKKSWNSKQFNQLIKPILIIISFLNDCFVSHIDELCEGNNGKQVEHKTTTSIMLSNLFDIANNSVRLFIFIFLEKAKDEIEEKEAFDEVNLNIVNYFMVICSKCGLECLTKSILARCNQHD